MQSNFRRILSSDDRAAIFSSLLAGAAYCGAIVLVCVVFALATGSWKTDGSVAHSKAIPDGSTSMPL
jgi:hypothetical protein